MTAFGKVTLRNYRCFDWDHPATLEFGDDFTAYIGPNNSGKSAALKSIYELRHVWQTISNAFSPSQSFRSVVQPLGVADIAELANDRDPTKFQISLEINNPTVPIDAAQSNLAYVAFEYDVATSSYYPIRCRAVNSSNNQISYDNDQIRQFAGQPAPFVIANPTIGASINFSEMHSFGLALHQSRYFPAFRNAINEGAGTYYDLPVGTALVSTWDQWKAGNNRSQKIAISRVEEEIAKLLGFRSLQINADQSGKTLDVIVDGRPQKLYEVGAGVAQLIIVLSAALVQKPPFILIDEPELNLHPSLQLEFLTTLGSYAQRGILFSTHSIGLARSSAQRIFGVQKIQDGVAAMHPFGTRPANFAEWLGELSYSSRADLGCEGILLVEGPTEVLCFQEFLRKVSKDHKFVLMSLGGSSLINTAIATHLQELKRLIDPSAIHIFIDSEKSSATQLLATDRANFLTECRAAGVNAKASERRATENYFEANGIRAALGPGYKPLEPYQLLKDAIKPWSKSANWKIAKQTSWHDIQNTDLGIFLAAL